MVQYLHFRILEFPLNLFWHYTIDNWLSMLPTVSMIYFGLSILAKLQPWHYGIEIQFDFVIFWWASDHLYKCKTGEAQNVVGLIFYSWKIPFIKFVLWSPMRRRQKQSDVAKFQAHWNSKQSGKQGVNTKQAIKGAGIYYIIYIYKL